MSAISIHAPRMGRDLVLAGLPVEALISIHAPRMGRDAAALGVLLVLARFQSTRPVWGATSFTPFPASSTSFQSTRPVWGATEGFVALSGPLTISIHAPRMGRDGCIGWFPRPYRHFNPRAPYGARRFSEGEIATLFGISIHAPRMGRDAETVAMRLELSLFQSTRPVWGATMEADDIAVDIIISIHAPRMGRDGRTSPPRP